MIVRILGEKLIAKIIVALLERLAKSTKNKVDDKIIEEVKKAMAAG